MASGETGIPGWFWQDDFGPIVGDAKEYDLFRGGIDEFNASKPATVLAHLRNMRQAFSELTKVYSHEHPACQWSALHGLGHLNHPLVRETVQSYLDAHRDELTAEDVQWIEGCRDGRTI